MNKTKSVARCHQPNRANHQYGVSLSVILKRLLSDVRAITGVALEAPCENMDDWVLKEGPMIDKAVLSYIECELDSGPEPYMGPGEESSRADDKTLGIVPEWLLPLWESFLITRSHIYLRCLRQILVFGYKTELRPTKDQNEEAFKGFLDSDQDVLIWRNWFQNQLSERDVVLFNESRKIISSITAGCDFSNVTGRHGPGSCYPPRSSDVKSAFTTYYDPIRCYYGYSEIYHCLPSFWEDIGISGDRIATVEDRIVAKITAVPKDSRGPRLICVHPAEAIWLQLGQSDVLCNAIEKHPLSRGRVSFTDQTVNGALALRSSSDRAFCTIDLKEASDRIDSELVRHQFGDYQYKLLSCSRASHYVGLDGVTRVMNKWAPMGNGLTFPVESLIFFALAVAGIQCRYGVICNDVYVFGDDIIVPNQYRDGVINAFTRAGLITNTSKTFWRGSFRESCGVDAFNGFNVTPIRVKKGIECVSTTNCISLCELAKRLRRAGYCKSAAYVYECVRHRVGRLPRSNNPDYSAVYEYVNWGFDRLLENPETIWSKGLQLHGIKARSVVATKKWRIKDEWFHLQDSLMRLTGYTRQSSTNVVLSDEERGVLPLSHKTSDRGLVYTVPFGVRSYNGVIPHLW